MKNNCMNALLALVAIVLMGGFTKAQAHPEFGTTVDFLDYVFYDHEGPKDIYPVEVYEKRLKEMADAGFKRIYLRVNCLGLTLYPTKVARLYGEGFAWHWDNPEESKRLTNTVRAYDVCAETIRICHKYGMEAYAWESLADGGDVSRAVDVNKYGPKALESKGAPMTDPFYFDQHLECYSMRNPRLVPDMKKAAALTAAARKFPIVKVVFTETEKRPPLRITADTIVIFTSADNKTYTRYDKPFRFEGGVNAKGLNTFTLSGLNIKANYVKFGHRVPFTKAHNTYTFAMRGVANQMQVYNSQGQQIAVSWHANIGDTVGEQGSMDLQHCESTGWDYDKREIGFEVGVTVTPSQAYHLGVPEFNVPLAMEHQLARFAELAAYPFDGFMMNLRSHSWVSHPEEFGFNPEIREIYKQRYGTDIWTQPYDIGKIMQIRAEGVARFYKGCKELCGNRPFWVSGLPPAPFGKPSEEKVFRGMGTRNLAWVPSLYKTFFKDGSVDGVMMIGGDFSAYFTPEVTGGKPLQLGIFRECGGHLAHNRYYYPEGYDFEKDMRALYNHPRLSCVELYETLNFTSNLKARQIVSDLLHGK